MPYDAKIWFTLRAGDQSHYFFRDKWVMRKVAERYLPAELFRQDKKPFPINAYSGQRMRIAPAYFERSYISELFELGRGTGPVPEAVSALAQVEDAIAGRLGAVVLIGTPKQEVVERLRQHVSTEEPRVCGVSKMTDGGVESCASKTSGSRRRAEDRV